MRNVCRNFAEGHKAALRGKEIAQPTLATRRLISFPLEPPLFAVIQAFVDLQEARHEADYNLDKQWNRLDALDRVQTARQAFADWKTVRNSSNAVVFVTAMLLQKSWGR